MTEIWYWSSTFNGYDGYYFVNMSDGDVFYNYNYRNNGYVRPVLTSW